jgi:hypothetical protein
MEYRQKRPANKPQMRKKRVFTAADEEPASPHYAGHYAGLHPEDAPHVTTADVRSHLPATRLPQEPDDYEAGSYINAIAKRYDGIPMPDVVIVPYGNDQIYLHKGPRPVIPRANRTQTQAEQPQTRTTEQIPAVPKQKQRRFPLRWLLFICLALAAMLIGFIAFNAIGAWWILAATMPPTAGHEPFK